MAFKLGDRSLARLDGVHPDLVRVVKRAIELTPIDFTVLEGLRSRKRQEKLVAAGSSWTLNSRHLTGHAVDFGAWVDGRVDWSWPLYPKIADAFQRAADELGVRIIRGVDWRVRDGGHIELDRRAYPSV